MPGRCIAKGVHPVQERHLLTRMPSAQRRIHRRPILAALLGLTVVGLGAGAFSLAIFTDTAASTGSFASGTIDITSSPAVAFNVAAMMPGDASTATMTIANAGTAQLRYAMSTTATTALSGAAIGSNTQGAQAGDRTLAAASNEVLCFRVTLPLTAANTLQGLTSAATLTFDAEQVANNP